jgi:hypothetical protein
MSYFLHQIAEILCRNALEGLIGLNSLHLLFEIVIKKVVIVHKLVKVFTLDFGVCCVV